MSKVLRPFFSFYGSKWRTAIHYPNPQYQTLVQPFAGSAGYSIRHYSKDVYLYDLDPVIYNLWKYLIQASSTDIRSLPLISSTQSLCDLKYLCDQQRSLIGFWLNKGCTRPSKTPSSWMRKDTDTTQFWSTGIRDRVANQVDCIRHWKVFNTSYQCSPDIQATWFIDPPYQVQGVHYRCGSSDIDYTDLSAWCKSKRGQVMVCQNLGAQWLPFKSFKVIPSTTSKKGAKTSHQVLWCNKDHSCKSV